MATIPINETILFQHNWRSGSLFEQLNPNFTVYPGNNHDQQVVLDILADNLARLSFNGTAFNAYTAFPLLGTIFDPDRIQFDVNCVYPISGQYGTLSRALFYVLLVFSLIFRRHVWISVAALGTAMTYGGVAAIHLFALVGAFDFRSPGFWNSLSAKAFGDIDYIGIFPILTASGIMLTPILMWSTSVRKHHAQAVIVYWGLLIFAALATTLILWVRGGFFEIDTLPSFASCGRTPECIADMGEFLSREYYARCGCFDFCGTLSPTAPMRAGANMVPFLFTKTTGTVLTNGFGNIFAVNFLAIVFITLNGFIGIVESYFSQSEVRNGIFRFLNSSRRLWIKVLFEGQREHDLLAKYGLDNPIPHKSARKTTQYYIAKFIAACFYMSAIFFSLICPAVFISTVVVNELYIQAFPVSEHSDAIGAWGAWVGAVLVLFAAVIDRYYREWVKTLLVVLAAGWRVVGYRPEDRPTFHSDNVEWSIRERIKLFGLEIASPFVHGWYSTRRAFWTGKTNLKLFAAWWKDTVHESQLRRDDLERVWKAEETKTPGGKPICSCRMCWRDRRNEKLSEGDNTNEPSVKAVLDRVRNRVIRAGDEYQSVSNTSTAPIAATEMSKIQPISVHTIPSSTPIFGAGETGSERYDRPATPPSQAADDRILTPVAQSPASPNPQPQTRLHETPQTETFLYAPPDPVVQDQAAPPDATVEHRRAFARRDTDQSIGSSSGGQDQSQRSRPRRKPVPSYIAPKGGDMQPFPYQTAPDQAPPC